MSLVSWEGGRVGGVEAEYGDEPRSWGFGYAGRKLDIDMG